MTHAHTLATGGQQVALLLYGLLRELDPARRRNEWSQAARESIGEMQVRVHVLLDRARSLEACPELTRRLHELADLLNEHVPARRLPATEMRDAWADYRGQLARAYEELSASLGDLSIHVPSLRPTNYARNAFHLTSATVALLCIQYLPGPEAIARMALIFAISAWTMEIGRRLSGDMNTQLMKLFGPVAHPHEHKRVNSATWYATALVFLALSADPMAAALAVTVLGVGDPVAALIGRRWGRIKLLNGRSLEGTLAFVGSASIAAYCVLRAWYPELVTMALPLAVGAALAGALAELVSRRVDDNFSIPISTAVGAWVVMLFIG